MFRQDTQKGYIFILDTIYYGSGSGSRFSAFLRKARAIVASSVPLALSLSGRQHTTPSTRALLVLLEFIGFYFYEQCKLGHTIAQLLLVRADWSGSAGRTSVSRSGQRL